MTEGEQEYEFRTLSAPCLSGLPFKLFVRVLESPFVGRPVRRRLLNVNGFTALREAYPAESLGNAPRVALPLHPPVAPSTSPSIHPADCSDHDRENFIEKLDEVFLSSPAPTPPSKDEDGLPLSFDSIRVLRDGYHHGEFTPVQIAHACLARIEASNTAPQPLNAIIAFNREAVLADAAASEARWKAGRPLSCLDGVPVAIKCQLNVKGLPCTAGIGYKMDPGCDEEEADGGIASALRRVGAIVSIAAAMDEMGVGVRGFNAHIPGGQVRNPLSPGRSPGGSSSGCAAAVASGLVPCAIGTDGGGSCRIPAASCGIVGLKPTFARVGVHGRCQEREGVIPTFHVGPLANNVIDLDYLYNIIALLCPHQPVSCRKDWNPMLLPLPLLRQLSSHISDAGPLAGVRVGVYSPWLEDADATWVEATRRMLTIVAEKGGAEIREVSIPNLEYGRVAHGISILNNMLCGLKSDGVYADHSDKKFRLGLDARSKMAIAGEITEEDIKRSEAVRAAAMRTIEDLFSIVDFLVTPALGEDPTEVAANLVTGVLDVRADSTAMRFMLLGNFTGIPGCVFPVGTPDELTGLRRSVQVMGKPWHESELLRFVRVADELCEASFGDQEAEG